MALGVDLASNRNEYQESFLVGWRRPEGRADNLTTFMIVLSGNSQSLNVLEPWGPVRACNGIAFKFSELSRRSLRCDAAAALLHDARKSRHSAQGRAKQSATLFWPLWRVVGGGFLYCNAGGVPRVNTQGWPVFGASFLSLILQIPVVPICATSLTLKKFYVVPTQCIYSCVLYGSQKK
jgi:hypothetical protein